jgi:hypothetical protein
VTGSKIRSQSCPGAAVVASSLSHSIKTARLSRETEMRLLITVFPFAPVELCDRQQTKVTKLSGRSSVVASSLSYSIRTARLSRETEMSILINS